MQYQLKKEQLLNCDMETAWKFFSSPKNLSKITPKEMNFIVLTEFDEDEIFQGMEIDYTVSPLFHIPLKWKTLITQVNFHKSFTDLQEKGPFKYWTHYHEFFANENGVLMKDTVDYELPFGFLGKLAHRLMVKKKLEEIFNFRYRVLENTFNKKMAIT
jgi:ligand-binding SRPBCC domain-containing protein